MEYLSKPKIINGIKLLLGFLIFYFCIAPSILDLSGNMYDSNYFNLNSDLSVKIIVLIINLIFAIIFFYSFKDQLLKLLRNDSFWEMNDWAYTKPFKFLIFICATLFLLNNISNFDLERALIKESSGVKETIIQSTLFALLSFWLLIERKLLIFFSVLSILFVLSVSLFEREILLYAFIPVALRIRQFVSSRVFVIGIIIGLSFMVSFKYFVIDYRGNTDSSVELLKEREILEELSKDASSKYGIEVDYFNDSKIQYTKSTYLGPYQLFRLFDTSHSTNGQKATRFYTNDYMGTGFSAPLESWLNLGMMGVFIAPLLIVFIVFFTIKNGGPIMLFASILFVTKLLRGEFWVAYTLYMLFPFIFVLISNFFFKKQAHLN